jgi:tetratricopeptide (TPR) repeat protein
MLGDNAAELARTGNLAHAIVHYRAALLVAPDDAGLHLALARVLEAQRLLDAAILHARRAAVLRPSDPATSRLLEALEAARQAGG